MNEKSLMYEFGQRELRKSYPYLKMKIEEQYYAEKRKEQGGELRMDLGYGVK